MVLENVEYSAILLEGYASSSLKYLNWYLCYLQYDHVVIICTEEIQMLIKKKNIIGDFRYYGTFVFTLVTPGISWEIPFRILSHFSYISKMLWSILSNTQMCVSRITFTTSEMLAALYKTLSWHYCAKNIIDSIYWTEPCRLVLFLEICFFLQLFHSLSA